MALLTESFLPKVDGVSKTTFLTMRYLQETGREVLIFAPDIAPPSMGPTTVIPLPSLKLPNAPNTHMALPNPMIAKQLAEFQPDMIQLCSPAVMSVTGMLTARYLNIPIIANYQTDLPGYMKQYGYEFLAWPLHRWLRYIHNSCTLNLVPSQSTARELSTWGYRRLRLWSRGVNTERFHPAHRSEAMRAKLLDGHDPDSLLCVFVGRVEQEKRIDLLLDVARLPGVVLAIVGDGSKREELETLFAGTNTRFTGYLYGDDLAAAYASADVFVFTGPNETFGQVTQEAMSSGLPVIITNQGGAHDLVREGETGFVCQPDSAAFADAVQILRDNRSMLHEMAYEARQFAESRPWWKIMANLEDHYREALVINERFKRLFA